MCMQPPAGGSTQSVGVLRAGPKKDQQLFLTIPLHWNRTLGAAFGCLLQEAQGSLIPPRSERCLLLHLETLIGVEQEVRQELPELTHI